ncbi:hypothetical protein [Mycoplasmopsis felis]|uniref:hypothetical protein n=1 Tax=Mycoplasmopsis felis TaxID=33923 RepID=UPI000A47F8D1|nr:hypothetical protein [Mycoplasmopsis felis]WQQ01683.1 hypothetical protein RRG54_03815 [Mycoplasmopsis felis]WQQ03773.1 hypothetical protein RRG47_03015 [Mycoplasmopsis felis]WQQ04859.1 hypothetical protein RRG55_00760 [Mycoplasmopsis felis]WQQ07053.1 hypothetical protein RRG37_00205 [Mycoplasmopsis felis]WQQ08851.1 hypothetical protein RRG61_01900 [Mycoplasmopsis felis]
MNELYNYNFVDTKTLNTFPITEIENLGDGKFAAKKYTIFCESTFTFICKV